jgi:hypothetical protein
MGSASSGSASTPVPTSGTVEVVRPWDNRLEDRLVFALIGAILLLAASLMVWLYPPETWTDDRVPGPLRQDLTALANAGEELRLLIELEQRQPALSELVEYGITPFADHPLSNSLPVSWQQFGGCLLGTVQAVELPYQMRLVMSAAGDSSPYRISWRETTTAGVGRDDCTGGHEQGWHTIDNRKTMGLEHHVH